MAGTKGKGAAGSGEKGMAGTEEKGAAGSEDNREGQDCTMNNILENVSAAILVGRSTRMGRDKALLVLNQQTFIGHLAQELSVCREVFVSACERKDYSEYGLEVVVDENRNTGPLEGIRQSLRHAAADHVFICAVDMPFVRREMILYLAERISPEHDVWVFRDGDRIHPLCGIYSRRVLPAAQELIAEGSYRMRDLLTRVRTEYVDIAGSCFARETLSNINTPEEYAGIRQAPAP